MFGIIHISKYNYKYKRDKVILKVDMRKFQDILDRYIGYFGFMG